MTENMMIVGVVKIRSVDLKTHMDKVIIHQSLIYHSFEISIFRRDLLSPNLIPPLRPPTSFKLSWIVLPFMPTAGSIFTGSYCHISPSRFRLNRILPVSKFSCRAISWFAGFTPLKVRPDVSIKCVSNENQGSLLQQEDEEEEDELCPVECVKEFYTDDEFCRILDKAKQSNSLVVVDFYRTSCGSCKYIEQGFSKLCKSSGDDDVPVIFLKHNVMDEYDEQSEVADRLRIKKVPLFHFYKNGVLLEAFATRDKERITEAIDKYTSPAAPQSEDDTN